MFQNWPYVSSSETWPVPLKSFVRSCAVHGDPPCRVTTEFTCQPWRSCPGDFLPGISYVVVIVTRCRMSKSLFPYMLAGWVLSIGRKLEPKLAEALSRACAYVYPTSNERP